MKKNFLILIIHTFIIGKSQNFTLRSSDLEGQAKKEQIFNSFGCNGENKSPQLCWSDIPEGTKSFAVTIHDPDAPTGSGWWHWIVFDIPKENMELLNDAGNPENNLMPEKAIQSINDFGKIGYGGSCPPKDHGFHQYIVTVYALDTENLGLDSLSNPALVGFTLNSHIIRKASMIFYDKR